MPREPWLVVLTPSLHGPPNPWRSYAVGRPLRVEYANAFYHVHSRGNERRAIFRDDRDRERFLDLLRVLADRFDVEVWAYVLMPNHYHLVLRTLRPNLSRALNQLV